MVKPLEAVAIIVVNWNTPDLVLECLAALRKSKDVHWHLYLVDNASTDGSASRLCNLGPDVTFMQSPTNGGWTGGNNFGIRRALEDGYDRLFMLNSDAMVFPNTLAILLQEARHRPTAIIGPVQVSLCESFYNFAGTTIAPETGLPIVARTFSSNSPEAELILDIHPTAYVQGSGLLVTRDHFERLGLFDDRYYLNFDDTDFCAKARAEGFEVILIKAARLRHAFSGSIGGVASPLNKYFLTRNSLLFAKTHATSRQRRAHWLSLIRSGLSDTWQQGRLRRIIKLLFGKEPRLRAFRRGIFDYLTGRLGDCPPVIRQMQADKARH